MTLHIYELVRRAPLLATPIATPLQGGRLVRPGPFVSEKLLALRVRTHARPARPSSIIHPPPSRPPPPIATYVACRVVCVAAKAAVEVSLASPLSSSRVVKHKAAQPRSSEKNTTSHAGQIGRVRWAPGICYTRAHKSATAETRLDDSESLGSLGFRRIERTFRITNELSILLCFRGSQN